MAEHSFLSAGDKIRKMVVSFDAFVGRVGALVK